MGSNRETIMLTLANTSERKLDLRGLGEPESMRPTEYGTATDWFCAMFPTQVRVFGSPFLEQAANTISTPLVPNIDCLAACLGGDERLGHRVIYYVTELQFYFFDPADQMFHATNDQKMGNLLRGLLARCAAEVRGEGHLVNIFHTFRSDSVVRAVVNRAKSLLEADPDFFGVKSQHQRIAGPEIHHRLALVFAQRLLEPCSDSILTVAQTYTLFNTFAKSRHMPEMKRGTFKCMMAEVIRDAYDLGVRNDLVNPQTEKQQCGWKGLRPVDGVPA